MDLKSKIANHIGDVATNIAAIVNPAIGCAHFGHALMMAMAFVFMILDGLPKIPLQGSPTQLASRGCGL
jgi:hypothetical protein